MELQCKLIPKGDQMRQQLVARLLALGFDPYSVGDSVVVDYTGAFDKKAMTLISVFDSFGCDRAVIFKSFGGENGEGQEQARTTSVKVMLGCVQEPEA